MGYYITEEQDGRIKRTEVQGVPIRVRGFDFLELFMAQADGTYGLARRWFSRRELDGKYVITEATTGFNLFGAFNSPEEAYYVVSAKLQEKGVARMRQMVNLKRQQLGNMDL